MALRRRALVVLAVVAFAVVNTFNALNKGGDAQDFFEGGRRLLQAATLYEGSGPASGFIGPPFQAAFFAPFAALADVNDIAARLAWYGLNLLSLWIGVAAWSRAWNAARFGTKAREAAHGAATWFALLAILLPLQTNFEHQNMNALLLGMSGLTAWSLVHRRWLDAGALIGLATALKAFPALAILYAAARGWWTCAAAALAVAAVLTLVPLLAYGSSFAGQVTSWVAVASGGWPTRPQNQSLIASIDRLWPGGPAEAVHRAQQVPVEFAVYLGIGIVLLGVAVLVTRGRGPAAAQVPVELAAVIVLSVLLSPVAWDHYWVLLFPAYLLIYEARDPRLLGRRATMVFWTAAVMTSGLSRVTLGATGWMLVRSLSVQAAAALLLYGGLAATWPRLHESSQHDRVIE